MRPGREGFSLIEALVALTIAAIMLTAIFELQQQMIRGQRRAADVMDQVAAQENALALMKDINPSSTPSGQIVVPQGDTIRWSSKPVSPTVVNAGFPTGNGTFEVTLYEIQVDIIRDGKKVGAPLIFQRMGWWRISGT